MAPEVPFPRPLYPPSHAEGPSAKGDDVVGAKRAISRAGFWPWQDFDNAYSEAFAMDGVRPFQQQNGLTASGNYGSATHEKLRKAHRKGYPDQWAFDGVAIGLMEDAASNPPASVPALGPTMKGGKSVLDQDCTHATSGIPLYPAFDDAFSEGATVIAPEPLTVTRQSSSNPGQAFYADGASGLRYWFGHLDRTPAVGTKYGKGATVGKVCHNEVGGGPHVHVAVNVERLWGTGKQLKHHTNYTHGAPLIGVQLAGKL
jgi:peptidoglycan hydrolase-like protein with peptidoglycan-binding domain